MGRKAGGWALLLACLLLLSFAATTHYSKPADLALIFLRLAIVFVLSVLVVRERWRHRSGQQPKTHSGSDMDDTILQRFRRWYYDEQKRPG